MSSARFDRIFGSTSFRLAAMFAGLLFVTFVLAVGAAWFATKSTAENELHERIALEMDALQDELILEGETGVIATVVARAHNPGALEYRLLAKDGKILIGNLRVDHSAVGWHVLDLPSSEREDDRRDFVVLTQPTPEGGLLSIGHDLARAEQVQNAVLEAFLWVGIVATGAVLAVGAIAMQGAFARVDILSDTLERAGKGDLSARVPVRSRGDDIDRIGHGVNDMLTRIDTLVGDVKRVSTNIAHDLRTPLAHVRQKLETATTRSDIATVQDDLKAAGAEVEDVLRIFDAMLRLSEIEAGAAKARFGAVDLSDLVERVTDAYRPDIEAAGHTLDVMFDAGAVGQGDAALIAQALANLLENAMRYAGKDAAIRVRLRQDDDRVRLEVEDSGVGIPAEHRDRMLLPFERLDGSRSSSGAGLGLSIVNAIARLHDGSLVLENAKPGLRAALVWPAVPA